MRIASIYVFFIVLFLSNQVDAIELTEFDENLYRQVLDYNLLLSDSYYCGKIPTETFLEFLEIYKNRPIAHNTFGMGSHGNFFLWYILKQIDPIFVIESGVFKGQSTWMIEKGAPRAKIMALDPDPDWRIYKSKKAIYNTLDFSHLAIDASLFNGPVVCFFDDRMDAFERVLAAHKKGFKHLIFNENYSACEKDKVSHLTLSQYLELEKYQEKGEILQKLIKHYYIMPQIIGKNSNYPVCESIRTNIPAIWENLEDLDSGLPHLLLLQRKGSRPGWRLDSLPYVGFLPVRCLHNGSFGT